MGTVELNFGLALKECRERAKMSQEELALASELDRTYISMLERNVKAPTITTLSRIAKALKLKASTLLSLAETEYNFSDKNFSLKKDKVRFPFMGTAFSCGLPLSHDYKIEKEVQIEDFLVKNPKKTFFVKASGDSMAPTILDGDVLIIEASSKAKNEDIVLVQIGNDFTIKRLFKSSKDMRLLPDNLLYKELEFSEEISVEICGVVVGFARVLL
jgi:DNA polymerase V